MSYESIGILGNGGQADEAESYASGMYEVGFRAVSPEYLSNSNLVDITNPGEFSGRPVIPAIGAPAVRKEMVESWPGQNFATLVSEHAYVDKSSVLAEGSIVAPRAVITTGVEIGKHSLINVAATISHDTKLGEYSTVGPGAHIGGKVTIGEGVFIGIGAIISNGVYIAPGSVVGAGAVVVRNIEQENSVVVGVPGKVIKINDGWLREV